jgi:mannose-6-phosphate isomerase-like protein (cupin superfamily)
MHGMKIERWSRAEAPTEAALRDALSAEGYAVRAATDAPGTTYPPHTHDDDQSHWIVSGELALVVGNEEYVLGPGDRDWLSARTMHAAHVVGPKPVTYLVGAKGA